MDRSGIDAVTSIAIENPKEIGIWCSSTPTGKRDFFYEICTNPDTGYKAYHFPSHVNPDFDETIDGQLRATMTEQGYIHEVLAEFGEETIGVFNKESVERAKNQYIYTYRELNTWEKDQFKKQGYDPNDIVYIPKYSKENPAPAAYRIIGVDWDKFSNATQIVVTEFNEFLKKFQVVNRVEIPRGDFTYDNAVKKIIDLNYIYDPKFIYVDAGHGEYQIEQLHLHGIKHPETNLHKKVKRIQFSQKIEIRDPGTREVDKKDVKNFMVNQTSILLDRNQILLSYFDQMLWKQMMDYQVVRVSQNGKPIYTSENEHALDAFMLTVLGFTLEFPDITKILEDVQLVRKGYVINTKFGEKLSQKIFEDKRDVYETRKKAKEIEPKDNPRWHWKKVKLGYSKPRNRWGERGRGVHTPFKRVTF